MAGAEASPPDEEFYRRARRELKRAVAAVCPRWLANQRDDIVQVALLKVYRLRSESEGERPFAASYLWRTGYSAMVDEIRRQRRRREEPLRDNALEPQPTPRPEPDRLLESRRVGHAVVECLAHLVRPRRLAVTLYLQGYTVPEAAELLEYGSKKTENLVYRGLADLRRCLAGKGLEP